MGLFDEEIVRKENHTIEDRILQPIREKFRIEQTTIFSAIMKIVADSKKNKLMAG